MPCPYCWPNAVPLQHAGGAWAGLLASRQPRPPLPHTKPSPRPPPQRVKTHSPTPFLALMVDLLMFFADTYKTVFKVRPGRAGTWVPAGVPGCGSAAGQQMLAHEAGMSPALPAAGC